MLYENFYYMIFTGHSAGKIWSSICMQHSVKSALHYRTNVIRQSDSVSVSDLSDRLSTITLSDKSAENYYLNAQNTEAY